MLATERHLLRLPRLVDDHSAPPPAPVWSRAWTLGLPVSTCLALRVQPNADLKYARFPGFWRRAPVCGQLSSPRIDLGFTEVIHALMHEDNVSRQRSERHHARVFRRSALMGRELGA